MPKIKTSKRHTTKAKSSAHLDSYLAEGYGVLNLAELLSVHVTTANGWLKPGHAPAWTKTLMDQRAQLRGHTCPTGTPSVGIVQVSAGQVSKVDAALDLIGLKAFWLDQ